MESTVSVIVPVYNGEKYIDTCMKCLLEQTYSNIEIILVNDGSKDKSGEICDRYAQNNNNVKVVHKSNGGLSSARNAGIEASTGEFLYFYDVDDEITPDLVKDNVELAQKHNADVVLFCFWYYVEDRKELIPNQMKETFIGNAKEFFESGLTEVIEKEIFNAPWNKMVRRSVMEENNIRFNTDYPIYEDVIFASEMFPRVSKVVVNKEMYYKYFVRSSGTLITRYYPNLFDAVSLYYKNIVQYCNKYENHDTQLERFNYLYFRLIAAHLKQVSCHKDLAKKEKYRLLKRICEDQLFRKAIYGIQLKGTKKIIRFLIGHKMYRSIHMLYNLRSK